MKTVEIIIADINNINETEEILLQIAPCYVKKYHSHKIQEDARQELVSGLLLKNYLGICKDEQLIYNEYEKPFLVSGNYHFNISHSGNYVVLAIADCNVGIDVEKIRNYHEATVKKVFNTAQKEELEKLDGYKKNESFTKIWTECEAVLKLRGIGFGEGWEKNTLENYSVQTIQFHDFFLTCATEEEVIISKHFWK